MGTLPLYFCTTRFEILLSLCPYIIVNRDTTFQDFSWIQNFSGQNFSISWFFFSQKPSVLHFLGCFLPKLGDPLGVFPFSGFLSDTEWYLWLTMNLHNLETFYSQATLTKRLCMYHVPVIDVVCFLIQLLLKQYSSCNTAIFSKIFFANLL